MNSLEKFNSAGLEIMRDMRQMLITKKQIEEQEKRAKARLLDLMEEYGVKSVDNEFVRITYVDGSESVSIDLKEMEKQEPSLYSELLHDYPKVSRRSPSIRITVK